MLASPEDWPTSASGAVRLAEALDDRSSPRGLGPSVVLVAPTILRAIPASLSLSL